MSVVTYNGITLPYALTSSFAQAPVRDDSGTDRMYTRVDVQCQCYLNADYLLAMAPGLAPGGFPVTRSPAEIMVAVRQELMKDRKKLSVVLNGAEMIPAEQIGNEGTADARNGPQPQHCTVMQMNNTTFLLAYHVIAHYWETLPSPPTRVASNTVGADVLCNRWTETVDIDDCNYSKRTRRGKYVIRSDNVSAQTADQVRSQMAVVGVPDDFLRESSSYTVTPDGLGIEYTVVDQEIYKKPPEPAFKAEGYFVNDTPRGGAYRFAECGVSLMGSAATDQSDLLKTAVTVCARKLQYAGIRLTGAGRGIFERGVLKVDLYKNKVDCSLRMMKAMVAGRFRGTPFFDNAGVVALCSTPLTDDAAIDYTPAYLDRGTASLLLQAAAYYDPNLRGVVLTPDAIVGVNEVTTTGGGANVSLSAGLKVGRAGKRLET